MYINEVIIGTTKYGFHQIYSVTTAEPTNPKLKTEAWIILNVDVPPQTDVFVIVIEDDETNYFTGQSQQVLRLDNGKYEVFCVGAPKANNKTSTDTKPSSHLTLLSNNNSPKQRTRRGKSTMVMAKEQEIFDESDLRHFDKDIRLMSRKELTQYFAADSSGRLLVTKLIKNIIWQAYERIKAGSEPPISGNLRSFWYLWVKPVLVRVPAYSEAKTDPYGVMLKMFTELIMDRHLCHYTDFDFTDEHWENRRIGKLRPTVFVFAEKAGWIRFLRELHEEFGVSILALGGAPSALTSEYTVRDINAVIDTKTSTIKLIGIVDYDPAGYIIAQAFQNQLADTGMPNTTLTTLIHPKHYTNEELKLFRYPLPTGEKTKLAQWLAKTGGIDGKAYGLESESMPRERLRALLRDLILAVSSIQSTTIE